MIIRENAKIGPVENFPLYGITNITIMIQCYKCVVYMYNVMYVQAQ